ncbi:MAG: hypothetical protein EOP06_16125, partial [Proteobacteria bacterium]
MKNASDYFIRFTGISRLEFSREPIDEIVTAYQGEILRDRGGLEPELVGKVSVEVLSIWRARGSSGLGWGLYDLLDSSDSERGAFSLRVLDLALGDIHPALRMLIESRQAGGGLFSPTAALTSVIYISGLKLRADARGDALSLWVIDQIVRRFEEEQSLVCLDVDPEQYKTYSVSPDSVDYRVSLNEFKRDDYRRDLLRLSKYFEALGFEKFHDSLHTPPDMTEGNMPRRGKIGIAKEKPLSERGDGPGFLLTALSKDISLHHLNDRKKILEAIESAEANYKSPARSMGGRHHLTQTAFHKATRSRHMELMPELFSRAMSAGDLMNYLSEVDDKSMPVFISTVDKSGAESLKFLLDCDESHEEIVTARDERKFSLTFLALIAPEDDAVREYIEEKKGVKGLRQAFYGLTQEEGEGDII